MKILAGMQFFYQYLAYLINEFQISWLKVGYGIKCYSNREIIFGNWDMQMKSDIAVYHGMSREQTFKEIQNIFYKFNSKNIKQILVP